MNKEEEKKGIPNGEEYPELEVKDRSGWLLLFAVFLAALMAFMNKYKAQTPQEVFDLCIELEIEHPEIVVKQSMLETGNYECSCDSCEPCSLDHNNLFGFRYKKQYLEFDTWEESIVYYKKFQMKYYKGQDYFDFLECIWKHRDGRCARFATSLKYIDKLKEISYENSK